MQLPARLGKYELQEFLGGGMSHVYKAFDTVIGRTVAVKILVEPAEQDLYHRYRAIIPVAERLEARGDLEALLQLLATLAPTVDRFFSDVLVMVDDPALRQNRLALAWHLAALFRPFGDLSQLGV